MKKKIILGLLVIIIFLNIMISLVFAANANIEVINLDYNGAVISVKSDEKINRVIMYKKDAQGNYVRFFENMETGYNEKNFFISRYSLSETDKSNFRVDVITESGRSSTENVEIDKVPEMPKADEKPTTESPKSSNTPNIEPSTKPSVSPSASPSASPSNTPSNNTAKVDPTSISLSKKSLTLTIGEKKQAQLKATMKPSDAKTKLTWSTKDKNVATVDKNGLVNGKKTGTTTITVKTENGLTAECKVTVKLKKISGTISKSNSTRWSIIDTANGCTSMQSVAVTDKYYICAKRRNDDAKGTILVYDKKNKKRVNVLTGNFGHANGATYNSDDGYVYVTHMKSGNVSKISTKNLTAKSLKRSVVKFPRNLAGIAYDEYTHQWVLKSGKNVSIYNKDLTKKNRSFTVACHTGQDCEVYKGLLLSIDFVSSSKSYVYIYNINSGECYGKYKVTLPIELESLAYDEDTDSFVMVFNDNGGDKLYRTKAINLKNYV